MKNWEVEPSVTYLIRHRIRNLGKKDAQAYRHGFMLGWKKGYDEDLPARYKNNYFWQEGYEAGVAHYCRAKGGPDANDDI